MKVLQVQPGTDEVNYSGQRYRVNNNGQVIVPDIAVADLLKTGGCTLVEKKLAIPEGMVAMTHPDARGASVGGQSIVVQDDGTFHVPAQYVEGLLNHGFEVSHNIEPEKEPEETDPKDADPKAKKPTLKPAKDT